MFNRGQYQQTQQRNQIYKIKFSNFILEVKNENPFMDLLKLFFQCSHFYFFYINISFNSCLRFAWSQTPSIEKRRDERGAIQEISKNHEMRLDNRLTLHLFLISLATRNTSFANHVTGQAHPKKQSYSGNPSPKYPPYWAHLR